MLDTFTNTCLQQYRKQHLPLPNRQYMARITYPIWNLWLSILDKTGPTVIVLTGTCVLYTWSAAVVYYSIGAILCSLSVKVIKKFIRQPRPPPDFTKLKKTYGMPSTHSAAISFLATYIILASLYLPLHTSFPSSVNVRLSPLFTTPWAIAVVMSRVWLGHHTWPQVIAGASYGSIFALVLFGMWRGGLNKYAERVAVFGLS